mgnify:CR=1 FL=1
MTPTIAEMVARYDLADGEFIKRSQQEQQRMFNKNVDW